MAKLTKSVVDGLTAPEGQRLHVFDDELKGFGVRVNGDVKSYIVQAWVKGEKVRVTIGTHGKVTPDAARREAKRLLGLMSQGINPNREKAAERAKGVTLGEVFDRYKTKKKGKKQGTGLSENTLKLYAAAMKLGLSDWTKRPISDITKAKVEKRHEEISNGKRFGTVETKRGDGKVFANRVMKFLRALLYFAAGEYEGLDGKPLLTYDAVRRMFPEDLWNKESAREIIIKDHELRAWHKAVCDLENETIRDYLLLILFTGLRRSEAASLKWSNVDLIGETFTVEADKAKNGRMHCLPMSDFVYALFNRRQEQYSEKSPYVFPTQSTVKPSKTGHVSTVSKFNVDKVAEASAVEFSLHILRHTFATAAHVLNIEKTRISHALNHTESGITNRYIHAQAAQLREPMQRISDYIRENAGIEKPPAREPRNAASSKTASTVIPPIVPVRAVV